MHEARTNTYLLIYEIRGKEETWYVDAVNVEEAIKINHKENHRHPDKLIDWTNIDA